MSYYIYYIRYKMLQVLLLSYLSSFQQVAGANWVFESATGNATGATDWGKKVDEILKKVNAVL